MVLQKKTCVPPKKYSFLSPSKLFIRVVWLITIALFLFIYLYKLGINPFGFFCDEAQMGIQSSKLVSGNSDLSTVFYNNSPFFYKIFGYILGSLTIFTTAPFISVFGLNEFAVRLPSSIFMLASFLLIYLIIKKKLKLAYGEIAVLLFALTPFVIHMGRIGWGHSQSLFFILLGFLLHLQSKERFRFSRSILSGICFGLSAYGYLGFFIASPLFVFLLFLNEILINTFHIKNYKQIAVTVFIFFLCYLPIINLSVTSESFFKRVKEKNPNIQNIISVEYAFQIISNYSKYYSYDYLFSKGEIDLPGGFVSRHSVRGSGMLIPITLPLLILSVFTFIKFKTANKMYFPLFFMLFMLYPLPDIITTQTNTPPYSFSVFCDILFLPFLVGYGIHFIGADMNRNRFWCYIKKLSLLVIVLTIYISGLRFFFFTYQENPKTTSDYWGWQSGPRDVIGYFLENSQKYDQFYMSGLFNQPQVFLDFYIKNPDVRKKAFIGDLKLFDPAKRQLFGVRKEEFDHITDKNPYKIIKTMKFPNGNDAFYLLEKN